MAKRGAWVPVKRGDHERVLITETLPFETPLIFSGDGFYARMKEFPSANVVQAELTKAIVFRDKPKRHTPTIPFSYKVRKGATEFRKLGVVHPGSLWDVSKFYESNHEWLLYQCSLSPLSIRAPHKVSGSFYERSDSDAMNQFKQGQVLHWQSAIHSRYNPSYFSYRGYDRLYKFFASEEFIRLEQQYGLMKTVDTSRCFDSIYTHSIVWATMGKTVAKDARQLVTRAGEFDRLMQDINHGETSGIIIGPEVSRVFAEIIYQRIDVTTMARLKTLGLEYRRDYEVFRYVDDVFIFANSAATIQSVYECYTNSMAQYNLYGNAHKAADLSRPFVTQKSEVIANSKHFIDQLSKELFEDNQTSRNILLPLPTVSPERMIERFIASLRSICFVSKAAYSELSSYILSACCERINRFVKRKGALTREEQEAYRNVALILIKIMFFLYTVAPTVNASFRFATGIILLLRFSTAKLGTQNGELEQLVFSEVCSFLKAEAQKRSRSLSNFVSLEALNVLILAKELGPRLLLPPELLDLLFGVHSAAGTPTFDWCYFDLISCIHYIADDARYVAVRQQAVTEVYRRLSDMMDLDRDAEKAYLFLDMLSCPFIPPPKKREWLIAFQQKFSVPVFTPAEITSFLAGTSDAHWFVGWGKVDLLTLLQKKELVPSY